MRHFIATKSENILSIGYDQETFTLQVIFKPWPEVVYTYRSVFKEQYIALMTAESLGSTFHMLIKDNPRQHPFTRSVISDDLRKDLAAFKPELEK